MVICLKINKTSNKISSYRVYAVSVIFKLKRTITNLTIYNSDNAPDKSKALLKGAKENFGFVTNLIGELAESPAVLEGYLQVSDIIGKKSFSAQEQKIAILAVSV